MYLIQVHTAIIAVYCNTYANFPNIGLKPNKIVTISIGFQRFGEGIVLIMGFESIFKKLRDSRSPRARQTS
jgi:hypothetical protein